MPDPTRSAVVCPADGRDRFRGAVAALPAGPLRDVLTAVAYGRDAAARSGRPGAPDDRWTALVAVAERAVRQAAVAEPVGPVDPAPASESTTVPGTHGRARRRAPRRRPALARA